ncbi:MAG TPA: MFS transporter [Gaiellales bacterium]|nr:MFS transporter [Gaiellales bacterium]
MQRGLVLLLTGELITTSSALAVQTALGWEGYARSGDPLVLGLIGLAEFVPALVFALPAGHAADHRDRRLVTAFGLAVIALATAGIAFDTASGDGRVWPLYAFALFIGIGQSYASPAYGPMLAAIATTEEMPRVMAMNATVWQFGTIAGPIAAGLLHLLGAPAPFVVAAAGAGLGIVFALAVPAAIGRDHLSGEPRRSATVADALEGVRFILRTPAMLGTMSLDLVAVLLGGATALLPVFSRDVLHVGALGNGLLRAAPGVGAVVVALVLTVRPFNRRVGPTMFFAVGAFGAFTLVFALSRNYLLSLAALAGLAAADMLSVFIRATLAPLLTPPELRGRVGAVERVFIGGSNELGAFESGTAAALIGAVPAVAIGGILAMVAAAFWAWRFPQLRGIDRFEDAAELSRPVPTQTALRE